MTLKNTQNDDEGLVATLRDDLTSAIRAKDADRVLGCFAAEPVLYLLAPPLQLSENEGAAGDTLKVWFATFQGPIGYEVSDLRIAAGADIAYCHSLNRISGKRSDGEATDIWIRETLGLRKVGGEWKIAHQHQSVPFYMDGSFKVAIDLTP